MRIAFLPVSSALGGAERVLLETMKAVREAEPRWELSLVAPGDGPLCIRAREAGAAVEILPFPPALAGLGDFPGAGGRISASLARAVAPVRLAAASWPAIRHARRLRRQLARIRPDVVHGNGFKANVLAALSSPPGTAVLWHVHDYLSPRPMTARIVRRFSGRPQRAIAVSESVAADIGAVCGPSLKVTTIHNTVPLDVFTPTGPSADLDALSGLPPAPEGTVRVGLVSTMAHWKGHLTFLESMAAVPAEMPVRGYIVGGPIYETRGSQRSLEELRGRARRLGLERRVGFTGFVDRPADAMRALDIVVHASTSPEPFGLVVAEAMACGRPAIVARAGGVMEFVRPSVDVLTHTPGDSAALAGCIATLASDAAARRRMGEAGCEAALARFGSGRFARDMMAVYRQIEAGGRAAF